MNPLTPQQSNQVDPTSTETFARVDWSVFPNPCIDWLQVHIRMEGNPHASRLALSLWDLTGRQVTERQIRPGLDPDLQRLDLSGLTPGVYLLTLETDSGVLSKKILKTGR
jgi:hypothetical protein